MQLLVRLLLNGVAVFLTAYILPGVKVDSFVTALIVAVVLGIINAVLKPILKIFALPITILTLGLFNVVINAVLILLVTKLVPGFQVDGFLSAVLFSIVLSIVNGILSALAK